jgi:hypothetical protein
VPSTRRQSAATFQYALVWPERFVSAGVEGINDMRQLNALLRSAPSRIGRRLAQIVAIAAASLPAAGA